MIDTADELLRASRALLGIAVRSFDEVAADLSLPQYRTLVVLADRGPLPLTALVPHVGVHQSTVTRLVERLQQQGLLSRGKDERDLRLTVLTLTPAGRDLVARVMERRRQVVAEVLQRLDPETSALAVDALAAFSAAAESLGEDVPTRVL